MSEVKEFYEEFSSRFIRDYLHGNLRVERQLDFLRRALHKSVRRVLIVGCGTGESAYFLASNVTPNAQVVGIDLSAKALAFGRRVFDHPRVRLVEADFLKASDIVSGTWDAIIFPDSFEHFPEALRPKVYERVEELLDPEGVALFTVPTPGKQRRLRDTGGELQIVDEMVSLEDFLEFAREIDASVSYYHVISVWEKNDYAHAVLERQSEEVRPLRKKDNIPLKRPSRSPLEYVTHRFRHKIRRVTRKLKHHILSL